MVTAFATTETAIEAMKQGAYDYLTKPFKMDEVRLVVEKALEKKSLTVENRRLRSELRSQAKKRVLIGNSAAMQRVYDLMAQIAETRTSVLVCGESGTGKELVARAIHELSDAARQAVRGGELRRDPGEAARERAVRPREGRLHRRGPEQARAVRDARRGHALPRRGRRAPAGLQVKLLRVLQERSIRRVGGNHDQAVDVRIIAATNRDLHADAQAGRFREDLYYRLNVIPITLPPLRERREDIPLLVGHFVEKYAREQGRGACHFSDAALALLLAYDFPGNVRELENTVERAVALSRGESIGPDVLPAALIAPKPPAAAPSLPASGANLDELMDAFERDLLSAALARTGGVKKRAAHLLGITFRSLRYRLEKLGLDDAGADADASE